MVQIARLKGRYRNRVTGETKFVHNGEQLPDRDAPWVYLKSDNCKDADCVPVFIESEKVMTVMMFMTDELPEIGHKFNLYTQSDEETLPSGVYQVMDVRSEDHYVLSHDSRRFDSDGSCFIIKVTKEGEPTEDRPVHLVLVIKF